MRAEALARKEGHAGAVAFSRTGDVSTGNFDDAVVIVALGTTDPETGGDRRLIGTAPAPLGGLPRGVARAVLNATNRVLGTFLATGD